MVPVKLAMRNFMSYRGNVPPLYFDGIHIACICGNNGNGKSSLIDAMTWALWGRARAKSDDELIHLHENEMEVEFDFAVGGQRYRVIRKHSRPKRRGRSGQTILEFQAATGNGFRSISGDSIAQTQQKITSLLHMDYETFINSALLLQGRADEFATKRPVERKQVLADILGLSFYDELEERAKELAKERETDGAQLESAIREIEEELAQKPDYEVELERAQAGLTQIESLLTEQESRLGNLRQQKEALESKKQQLNQLEEHIKTTARELERREEEIKQYQARLKEYEELVARRPAIEEGYAHLVEAKRQDEELNQKLGLLVRLNERKSQLELSIERAQAELLNQHRITQGKVSELEARSQKLSQLKNELKQLEAQLQRIEEEAGTLGGKKQVSRELYKQINHLESDQTRLGQEILQLEEKLNTLLSQTEARCPLCGTELGEDGLKQIELKYTADKGEKAKLLKQNQLELASRKAELETLEGEIAPLEVRLNQEKTKILSQINITTKEIAETEAAINQLAELKKALAAFESRLARKEFAISEQEALDKVREELARLDYDPEQHEEVRRRLSELEQYETPKRRLEEAERLISEVREAAAKAEEASRELSLGLEVANQKAKELAKELDALPKLASELAQAEAEHEKLAIQQREAQEILGSAKEKLQRLAELELKKKERGRLLSQALREEKIFSDLAQAFGKRGIQAMLIETALPEIEAEANRLLARMTDNRMHVKIETQRETKKGDLLETLDITIGDELGTRNYEMFSGGEAFRINFALRIALSKLLAQRAGAPLPTLIIDEGFGTQDIAGLEKIKEAINSIQDDFEKILVITHIEELKDAFPTRIDVIKTAYGSTIEVN